MTTGRNYLAILPTKISSSILTVGVIVDFVTRLKRNAVYKVIESRDVSQYENISSDQTLMFTEFYTKEHCPIKLRRMRCRDPKTGKWIVVLTNNFKWSPNTVSAIYKKRRQIEISFKTLKQNLKIKSFFWNQQKCCIESNLDSSHFISLVETDEIQIAVRLDELQAAEQPPHTPFLEN